MSDDVIAQGLRDDRYLKAVRLTEESETAVFATIIDVLDEVTTGPRATLFDHERDYDEAQLRTPASTYGTIRVEAATIATDDDGNSLMLNVGLEWVEPEAQGLQDWSEPLLRYALYKIKYAPAEAFETVAAETRESTTWAPIRVGDEQWDSGTRVAPGIFYVPLTDEQEFESGLSVLADHFETFGHRLLGVSET